MESARLHILAAMNINGPLSAYEIYKTWCKISSREGLYIPQKNKTIPKAMKSLKKNGLVKLHGANSQKPYTRKKYILTKKGEKTCENIKNEQTTTRSLAFSYALRQYNEEFDT